MTRTSRSIVCAWCLYAGLLMCTGHVQAQARMLFAIPAQSLETALSAFGEVTGYSVLVATHVSAGRNAPGVYGEFAPREALSMLLQGTGLQVKYSGEKAFTLLPDAGHQATRAVLSAGDAAILQKSITKALCEAAIDEFGRYRIAFQMWLDTQGHVTQVKLLASAGSPQRDAQLRRVLGNIVVASDTPSGLPQPVTIVLSPSADPKAECHPYLPHAD